jgi:hypothetical protein
MILGEPTGKEFSRSGRYFAIALDEAGVIPILEDIAQAAGNATRSVMYLGTPKGRNFFYQVCKNGTSIMLGKHDEHWNSDPCVPWDIHDGWLDKNFTSANPDARHTRKVDGLILPGMTMNAPNTTGTR